MTAARTNRSFVLSSHQTSAIKNQPGPIRTAPFGRANKLSSHPSISRRGANQKPSEMPTRRAPCLVQYVSVRPHSRNWGADLPILIFMFYTPKGLSKIACVAHASVFAARRAEFEAVARGVTLAR